MTSPVAERTERRAPATALVVVAVIAIVAADRLPGAHGVVLLRALGALLVVGLIFGARGWLRARNGQLALGLAAATAIVGAICGVAPWTVLDGAAAMIPAAVLLVTTSIVRPAFSSCGLDNYLAETIARLPARLRSLCVDALGTVTGLAAGFGSIAMLGSSLGARATPAAAAANAAMRGLSMSMLLGPSIASVAVVRTTLPAIPWLASVVTALPLLAASFTINAVLTPAIRLRRVGNTGPMPPHRLALPMLAAVPAIAFAMTALIGLGATEAITLAFLATGLLLDFLHREAGTLAVLDQQIGDGWRRSQAEIALFLASGAIASLLRDPTVAALVHPAAVLVPSGALGILGLLVAVPAICVVGLHPMPLFAMLAPLIPAAHLGLNATGLYQIWIVTIGISLLLSPASILTSITRVSFNLPPDQIGLRRNLAYAALVAAAALLLIPAINPA
jgi:hypothetical protein